MNVLDKVERFELLDMLNLDNKNNVNTLVPDLTCTVYVERELFDADLTIGLETLEDAKKQLKLDAPRCIFIYNKTRYNTIPNNIPDSIIPYCTQCVMGIPVTILFETLGMVAEGNRPMLVIADHDCNVFVYKNLKILKEMGSTLYNVNVFVNITQEHTVEIKFLFD